MINKSTRGHTEAVLFNHLICPVENGLWDREADLLRGLEIDCEFELRWLLNGKIAWLGAFQDLVTKTAARR